MKISFYSNTFAKIPESNIEFKTFLNDVKNGKWQDYVLGYRNNKIDKKQLSAVTSSGIFEKSRSIGSLKEHSGIICIDCDKKENTDILTKRELLGCDDFIYSFHISVGGGGLAIYFKIKKNKHLESFLAIEKYLSEKYQIIVDESAKDVSRLRYISWDPDLYLNEKSKLWETYLPKQEIKPFNYNPIYGDNDLEFVFQQIVNQRIDLTSTYMDWLKIGFAFASEYGESGREKFHLVSQFHPSYNREKTNKKFDNLLKSGSKKFNIGTFLWIAKQNNIKIVTEKTKQIQSLTNIRKKEIGTSGGAKDIESVKLATVDYFVKMENLQKEEVESIVEKTINSNQDIEDDKEISDFEKAIQYIKSLPLKRNLITKTIEYNGEEITDVIENGIFCNFKKMYKKTKVSKENIFTIINSPEIKEYNPFLDYFKKYSYLLYDQKFIDRIINDSLVDKLVNCFEFVDHNDYDFYGRLFASKWLKSIIASMHGTYSLLILVLTGEQMTNKTKFFRNLLPPDLQHYFAESKMDKGNDDEILMSKKLLILDDEFSGKSKGEYKKMKELSSKQKITLRKSYGRHHEDYNRYAVFCGTSNESDIINDPTGNRRIIPIEVKSIDFEVYESIDKNELFMELYYRWSCAPDEWMFTKEDVNILNSLTEKYNESSIEEEQVRKLFRPATDIEIEKNHCEFYTATEIMNICEEMLCKQRLYHKKLGQVLNKLKYKKTQKRLKGYVYCVIRINSSEENT